MDHHIPATAEALQAFLDQTTDPNLPTFDEVRGFVFAVANAPALIPPNRWLHLAFNGKLPEFRDDDEAKAAIGGMMRLYNNASSESVEVRDKAPRCRPEPLSNFEEDAPIAHWSRGFDRGQTFVEEQWELPLSTTQLEAFDSISMMLTCFASKELTAIACDQLDDEPISLEELAQLASDGFDEAIHEFAELGRTVFKSVTVRATPGTPVIPSTKVGRNDPCPCSSGKKYKRCCGRPS